jgi:hypothetical protein
MYTVVFRLNLRFLFTSLFIYNEGALLKKNTKPKQNMWAECTIL